MEKSPTPEKSKEEAVEEKDKLTTLKGKKTKAKPISKAISSKSAKSQSISLPSKSSESGKTSSASEIKSVRKLPTRRTGGVSTVNPSVPTNTTKSKEETVNESKSKKAVEKKATKPEANKSTGKLPPKLANKNAAKEENNKSAINNVKVKEDIKLSKAPQKAQKRKAQKNTENEVFDFEEDFEEEVMPIPKKRAAIKTYTGENEVDNTIGKLSSLKAGSKSDPIKDVRRSNKNKDTEGSSELPSPTKEALSVSKPSKRGRGRPKK